MSVLRKREGMGMEKISRLGLAGGVPLASAGILAAMLMLGSLTACAAGGSGSASQVDPVEKTVVKTAANEMTLVDWDVSAEDSPLTVSSDDARFTDYVSSLRDLSGYDIESLTMQVRVTEVAGAEIAATHENVKDNSYSIQSLEAVVDGKTISYSEGDFK